MLSPRWRKVVRDLWGNKLRTVLVVLSIAVGVFAVGMIAGTQETAVAALDASWNSTNPASVTLYTDYFDEELLYTVRHLPGVRAIGASDGSVFQIVVVEGLLIGLISWCFGAILAFPLGKPLSDAIGSITMRTSLDYVYSLNGLGMWLAIASILAVLASLLPARNASRVSVRDVLAYK